MDWYDEIECVFLCSFVIWFDIVVSLGEILVFIMVVFLCVFGMIWVDYLDVICKVLCGEVGKDLVKLLVYEIEK